MLNEYKVSVIVPVYNGEDYISKCINKLLNQTYKNIEVIVINDGSTDNTKELLFMGRLASICLKRLMSMFCATDKHHGPDFPL